MARLAAHLPDARVGLAPAARRGVGEVGDERLDLRVQLAEPLAVEVQRVEQLAVDVELDLVPRAVADAHGRRVAPAAQVLQRALGQVVLAADPVHDLQRALAGAAAGGARHERDELLGLVRAGADVERLEREARVADPGEAVVPVALAADRLGQRGGGRGDDRAGRAVGEALQDARAVAHEVAVRALVDVVLGLPRAPRLDGVVDAGAHRVRRRSASGAVRSSADAQRSEKPCASPARTRNAARIVASCDLERHGRSARTRGRSRTSARRPPRAGSAAGSARTRAAARAP